MLFGICILIPSLVKEYNLFTYEIKTEHGQRQIPFKDNNFILSCRQMNDHTPTQSMQIMDIDLLGNTNPMKVDRNLQWMSDHPTEPIYIPVPS